MRSRARIAELDSLRGLAAGAVMLGHWLAVLPAWQDDTRGLPGHTLINVLKYSPLRVLSAGPEAVLLFFVLSGFVLALPYLEGRSGSYPAFVVRRAFRIYPAAYVAIFVAAVLVSLVGTGDVVGADAFVNAGWHQTIDLRAALDHLTLLRTFDHLAFDGTLWSLVHELRMSIVFPVLLAGVIAIDARVACALAALLCVISLQAAPAGMAQTSLWATSTYVVCFVVGIALARHRVALVRRCTGAGRRARATLGVSAILLLSTPYLAFGARADWFAERGFALLLPTAGAAAIILLAIAGSAPRALNCAPSRFLGRVSYSVYLWHMPILMALTRTAGRHVAPIALAPLGIALALLVASASQRWIEVPATRAGASLARRIDRRRVATSAATTASATAG